MSLLELHEVRAGYGSGPDIVKDVSLEVEAGRSYCVIGPNGAGKSTMLRAICGLLPPRDGSVMFDGTELRGRRPDQILDMGLCFVPQDRTVFPEMTVKENLTMGGFLIKDRRVLKRRLDDVLDLLPILAERTGQLAQTMSGGEQQMLAIGRSLMIEPRVMMLDEPSLGLAPKMADQVMEIVERLIAELGVTLLMVEQNVKRGLALADYAFVLDLGSMSFEGSSETVLSDSRIRRLYLGSMADGVEGADADG